MDLYERIVNREAKIAVVGLGYVGMPIAYEFSRKVGTNGFDISADKVAAYKRGCDMTHEIGDENLKKAEVLFTHDENDLKGAAFFIVAVPTPINKDRTPDLRPIESASRTVGRALSKGAVVVFESTVYPGVTEDVCVPLLEQESGLTCGVDFKVGYSPERINPGDKVHTVTKIIKIVSGMDAESLDTIAKVYELIVEAGVYRADSIKVAEAAKVIENSQRDINIAFMNELSMIFNRMGIDTQHVLNAAGTKWNFLPFRPGLVGGHCIGVDPYYLTCKAEQLGYHPQVILSGRRINDGMGKYVAENTVKQLIKSKKLISTAKVLVMGFTFKEDVPDVRNTKVIDIVNELVDYGVKVFVSDPVADRDVTRKEYGITLYDPADVGKVDAIVMAVPHREYSGLGLADLKAKYADGDYILMDVKARYSREEAVAAGFSYWRL